MKIFLLNANNFGGPHDAKPLKKDYPSDYNEVCYKFQNDSLRITVEKAIISAVEAENPDVVVFQEFDVNAPAGKEAIKWFREHEYQPIYPDKESTESIEKRSIKYDITYSITMMFVKEQLQVMPCASPNIKEWKWCVAEVDDFQIVGVHIPDGMAFLDKLKEYAVTHKSKKMIILGDFNIATNEWRAEERKKELEVAQKVKNRKVIANCKEFFERRKWLLETVPSIDYSDAVKDDRPTYFREKTTIDHVLASPALEGKVTANVIPQDKLELSDHAVIIVDIKE